MSTQLSKLELGVEETLVPKGEPVNMHSITIKEISAQFYFSEQLFQNM